MSDYSLSSTLESGRARSFVARHLAPAVPEDTLSSTETGNLSVLHVTARVGRQAFGVGAAALSLGDAQRELGHRVQNWSSDTPDELLEILDGQPIADNSNRCWRIGNVYCFGRMGSERWPLMPNMHRALNGPLGAQFQVLHQHSIWSACSLATRRWRRTHGHPTVISPQGTLDAWALRKSRIKKWVAANLFEKKNLHDASCIHAVSLQEVAACREFGLRNPVALIPNGVSQKWLESHGDGDRFRLSLGIPSDKRIMLFLSRVTPKKGLPMFFKAIQGIGHEFDDWLLVIAGPDQYGHTRELLELATQLGIERNIRMAGPLYGQDHRDAYAAAELFVLPTLSEGHPIALLEAMGVGVPVLTTTGAYCEFIPSINCGWQTEVDVASLRDGLRAVVHCESKELQNMGQRGRQYVAERYHWNRIALQTVSLYQWLCGQGSRPSFVTMD